MMNEERNQEASTKVYDLLAQISDNHKEGLAILAYTAARIIKNDKGPEGVAFVDVFASLIKYLLTSVPPIPTSPSTKVGN